jgi:glycosyltransferase involved in cell wall biosynthesis
VPHLADAARRLEAQGFAGEIRAVGPHDGKLIHRAEFAGPNYVGQVPRSEVKHEFLGADIFAFPTLSDGFGVVLLEAMAAGLPVVCTRNCADVVRDGVTGVVVAPGDAEALASSIQRIVSDRGLRKTFSENARRASAEYSLESYSRRLIEAIGGAR